MVGGRAALREMNNVLSICDRGISTVGDLDDFLARYASAHDADAIAVTRALNFGSGLRARHIPEAWMRYHDRYAEHDAAAQYLMPRAAGRMYGVRRLERRGHLASSNPLVEGLDSFGFGDAAITSIENPFGPRLFVALYRERGKRQFSRTDETSMRLLAPHTARAFAMRAAQMAIAHESANVGSLIRRADGYVWLEGADLVWPPKTITMLEMRLDLGPRKIAALGVMLRREARRLKLSGSVRRMRLGDFDVEFVAGTRDGQTETLALFYDRQDKPRLNNLAELLSKQQRRVAEGLIAGRTTDEIASDLGVGRETVRTHLRSLATRYGTKSRSDLVLRLTET